MSNEPQKRHPDARTGPGPDPLSTVLTGFAGARSGQEVLDLLQGVAAARFGAGRALLLTLGRALAPGHRVARLTGGVPPCGVTVGEPAVERLLQKGAVFTTDAPARDLPGVPVPEGAGPALLVPCSGPGSTSAVCAFWPAGARPPGGPDLEPLRLLAATAGLAFDRQVAELRGRLLEADLDNRIRNVLAVIRSVGSRSAERAVSIEDFLLHFEGRIDAIGRAQIAAGRGGGIGFELLLREELLAQTIQESGPDSGPDSGTVSLDGMDVSVTAGQAEALGLAIHELAVNAVKFGAFAGPGGALAVRWWVESGPETLALTIDWRESLGASAALDPPCRTGFGLTFIERALPFQIDAEVTTEFAASGLRCRIAVPLRKAPGARARPVHAITTAAMSRPGATPKPDARRREPAGTEG